MSESAASPLDALASMFEEYKYGPGKNLSIIRSSSAIVSLTSSALLVWIIFRSRNGIKTTYNRLILGLSVSDILFSFGISTFGAVVPSEMGYVVWNARGSRASCDAFGFLNSVGAMSGLIYMCSLSLYYLAKVKFNKSDSYIGKKLERWLLVVPFLYGLIVSIVFLVKQRINANISGSCGATVIFEPPHCEGYDDGVTPEGFEIPCGRGRSSEIIVYVVSFVSGFLAPITIGGSLWTIYRSIARAERRIAQYGAGSLRPGRARPTTDDAAATDVEGGTSGGGGGFPILSAVKRRLGERASRTSPDNRDSSQSRAVLQKAAAYSGAWFVTWIWQIINGVMQLAGAWPTEFPLPKWATNFKYVWSFFQPLQGFWTLLVYMQPDVVKRRRSSNGNVSWLRAFADALWSAVAGPNGKRNTSTSAGSTVADRQRSCARDRAAPGASAAPDGPGTDPAPVADRAVRERGPVRPAEEGEKREIEPHEEEEEKCEIELYEAEEEKREIEPHDEESAIDSRF